MDNLTTKQALSIWSDLEAAFYGRATGFGGNTVNIHPWKAVSRWPRKELTLPTVGEGPTEVPVVDPVTRHLYPNTPRSEIGLDPDLVREAYARAHASLYELFEHYAHECKARIDINGRELGEWVKTLHGLHASSMNVTVTPIRTFDRKGMRA